MPSRTPPLRSITRADAGRVGEAKPLVDPHHETLRGIQVHGLPESKAVFVEPGTPVVTAVKDVRLLKGQAYPHG